MAKILISGGTGLVGTSLGKQFVVEGHQVITLSRTTTKESTTSFWDIENKIIDVDLVNSCEVIIHLAGANISNTRWTKARKKVIINSRVQGASLLYNAIRDQTNVKYFISASAVGYYGAVTTAHVYEENDKPYNDFLSKVCQLWEAAADQFQAKNIKVIKLRTGVVLSDKGGAFKKFEAIANNYLAAPLASGKQFVPWIHIDDLVRMYIYVLNHNLSGSYNAVAPQHVSNKDLMIHITQKLNKPMWPISVPKVVLRLGLGEMAKMLTEGSKVSCHKIKKTGFKFNYENIDQALKDLT